MNDPEDFAQEWATAWNDHDLDRLLAHFHAAVVFRSMRTSKSGPMAPASPSRPASPIRLTRRRRVRRCWRISPAPKHGTMTTTMPGRCR